LILPENNKKIITSIDKPNLSEVIPAIPTVFTINNKIDYVAMERIFKEQKDAGITEVLIA
jgi:dihydrodipicolinate synthase/N-acetylneuraminate lyase